MKKDIYIELDSLYDTRLVLARILDPKSVIPYVESGEYFRRYIDNFGNISSDVFNAMYKNRNKLLLLPAMPTNLFPYLRDHYGEVITDIRDMSGKDIYIYVNTYPYRLTEKELKNIETKIVNYIPKSVIKFINMSPYEVTPKWISSNVGAVYMYNLLPWLEYYTATTELFKDNLLECICIGPSIVYYTTKDIHIDKQYFIDLMDSLRLVSNVHLVPAGLFSINTKNLKKDID